MNLTDSINAGVIILPWSRRTFYRNGRTTLTAAFRGHLAVYNPHAVDTAVNPEIDPVELPRLADWLEGVGDEDAAREVRKRIPPPLKYRRVTSVNTEQIVDKAGLTVATFTPAFPGDCREEFAQKLCDELNKLTP